MNKFAVLAGSSVLIHTLTLVSVNHSFYVHQAHLERERQSALKKAQSTVQFQFVEAPPKVYPRKPAEKAKRISDRDALNQDESQAKSRLAGPRVEERGPSDQLAQKRGSIAQLPSPRVDPVKMQKRTEEKSEKEEAKSSASDFGLKPAAPEKSSESGSAVKMVEQKPQALVEPLPEKKGLTGQDKITTQEMSRAQSHGAALFGVTSFEATGSGMGEYMKNLKEKIWLAWFPYLAFHYPQDTRGADAVVSITLDAQGKVKILRLIENEGSPVFATYCLEAIQRAGTFGPLPEEILILTGKDEFEIKFGFHYR